MSSNDSLSGAISAELMQSVSKWFYGNITFDQANKYLKRFPVGTGLIRKSSQDDKLVLVVNEAQDSATCNHRIFESAFKGAPGDAELQKVISTVLNSNSPIANFPKQIIWTASNDDESCGVKKGQKYVLIDEEAAVGENKTGKALLLSPEYQTVIANPSCFISTKTRTGSENLASKIMNRQSGPAKSRRSGTNSDTTSNSRHSRDSGEFANMIIPLPDKRVFGTVFDYFKSEYDLLFIDAAENESIEVVGWNVISNLYTVKNKQGVKGKIPSDCVKLDPKSSELMRLYYSHYETAC